MGIDDLMIIIVSLLIIFKNFVGTYFYSSFLVSFFFKTSSSTDTLQSIKKRGIQIYCSKAIPSKE